MCFAHLCICAFLLSFFLRKNLLLQYSEAYPSPFRTFLKTCKNIIPRNCNSCSNSNKNLGASSWEQKYIIFTDTVPKLSFSLSAQNFSPPKVEKSMRRVNTSNTYSNTNINNSYSINIKVSITSVYWRGKFDYLPR